MALAAIQMTDVLDGSDHSSFLKSWVEIAKKRLTHKTTGMLISSYEVDGTPAGTGECPEGSSIFMSAHMLEIVDPAFAQAQYKRAKDMMGDSFLGFGYAREWNSLCVGTEDIDSGPIIPFLNASAAASGMALLGAASFDDDKWLAQLLRSLQFMGFPTENDGKLMYQASNPVGDAVLLYALVEGPLWKKVMKGTL